jgi:5-hydroxyisourate hydrolase
MKHISTHILDLVRGTPAADVPVRLETQSGNGDWRLLASSRTDPGDDLAAGVYRLIFETSDYFAAQKIDALYPVVQVTFRVKDGESHFHIPLLLSPNGYTTYRGT